MKRHSVVMLMFIWIPFTAWSSGTTEEVGNYAEIDNIRMYYEDYGKGEPLVFIHGGFGSSEMWKPYVQILSTDFRVITLDSRGQGRSSDGKGPITYGRMANDVVRLLDHLGIEKAHIIGHSDGGCIILHLLVDFSDRVQSAVLSGTPFNTDNYPPQVFEHLQRLVASLRRGEKDPIGFKAAYEKVAPDPGHWPVMITKLTTTWLTQPVFTANMLQTIRPPVLIIKVDHDQFLPSAVFDRTAELIPNAEIYYVPDGTHRVPLDSSEELAKAIKTFVAVH
jgi:pimeloyl-ACP methyl ester carboxylesterase